ncbi:DUF4097 family beta strand repeat-containing protein [Halorarum salinum]|uniref:Adhesin domain-containing protein n=1 Tax=Halorarum salinum TaxID=2743089 RepID=A0A7D5QE67_9EURY|nr:hypothetical protein [Halobaculum salinum]QLG60482.1 hypothetical protein HUG12_01430 [Halobaculum salinum]
MDDHRSPTAPARADAGESSRRPTSRRALLGCGAAALASLAGCAGDPNVVMGKRDESSSTFDLADGSLRIDADYGQFRVRPADDDAVHVRVEKSGSLLSSLASVDVSARREGDAVVVESTADGLDFVGVVDGPDVTVDVDIPSGVGVATATVEAGGVLLEDVRVHADGEIHAENGGAVARRVEGDLAISTGNGGAVAEDVAGFVTARSRNGAAAVYGCDGIDGASTSNGGIEADVTALRGDTELSTVNGGVASTENGGVDVTDASLSDATVSDSYVEGTIGEGTHTLRVEAANGGVTLSGPTEW